MFNYGAIDKTPTVIQVKKIIEYMEKDDKPYNFNLMMSMNRIEPNVIHVDLNDAHFGHIYEVVFDDKNNIIKFESKIIWMS